MAKWADYCISGVRYDDEHKHIDRVRVHIDGATAIGGYTEWTRSQVIVSLDDEKTFVTITMGSEGKWHKGEEVHDITVNRTRYIRTDNNGKAADNLENLPEF